MLGLSPGGAAVRIALALAIGLMIGFEREWSNKDAGIRTCALTALAGMLAALVSPLFAVAGLAGILLLVVFLNLRSLYASQSVEITTSAALLLLYVLGVMVGNGDFFTPVAAAIVATFLLTWKLELHRFAGELHPNEIRGAVWLVLLAFVVYPLLPDRYIDRWQTVNLHSLWMAVIVVAAVGFGNYVLMRLYSARGMIYSALLGGLVSSTATVLELGATLKEVGADLGSQIVPLSVVITLLATLAMFGRNLILLALFFPASLRWAVPPLLAMAALAALLIWRRRNGGLPAGHELKLGSPISLRRVAEFGILFLVIQMATTLGERHWGGYGVYAIAVLGGIFNSASTTAAVGEMAAHHALSPLAAGVATVLASMASAVANAPVMNRVLRQRNLGWTNERVAWALAAAGAAVLFLQQARI
ncbi:MAG: MgtC/SapB family protein [Terriglobales bacterium]